MYSAYLPNGFQLYMLIYQSLTYFPRLRRWNLGGKNLLYFCRKHLYFPQIQGILWRTSEQNNSEKQDGRSQWGLIKHIQETQAEVASWWPADAARDGGSLPKVQATPGQVGLSSLVCLRPPCGVPLPETRACWSRMNSWPWDFIYWNDLLMNQHVKAKLNITPAPIKSSQVPNELNWPYTEPWTE